MSNIYRPEIDGLRAIAVLSVVLYHLRIPYMDGGFVGVDVFFVISGFLITQKIYKDISFNSFSFASFYLARIRRIFPALIITIIATFILSVLLMSPIALRQTAGETLSAIFSSSNVFFWLGSGYFDSEAYTKPLLHTWSLSVEEQFYLFWPALILVLASLKRVKIHMSILIVTISGLLITEFYLRFDPSGAFFLTPFRIYEFAIGGFLATIPFQHKSKAISSDFLLSLGLVVIIYGAIFYDESTRFPGLTSLAPCLGTAICIYVGRTPLVSSLLTNRVSVFIGKISYSFYLVHWPIIVFAEYVLLRKLAPLETMGVFFICIVCSIALYKYIELPFRDKNSLDFKIPKRKFINLTVLGISIISVLSTAAWTQNGWSWRLNERTKKLVGGVKSQKDLHRKIYGGSSCSASGCQTNTEATKHTVYVIGDSHARALHFGLKKNFPDINFMIMAPNACSVLVHYKPKLQVVDDEICTKIRPEILKKIKDNPFPIIFAQHWATRMKKIYVNESNETDSKQFANENDYVQFVNQDIKTLRNLVGGNKILLIGGIPRFDAPFSPLDCISRPFQLKYCDTTPISSPYLKVHKKINQRFAEINSDAYQFIDPFDYFCRRGSCRNFDKRGDSFYSDNAHLSKKGSDYLVSRIKPEILELLDQSTK